jgi:uncharacterized protein YkwD
MASTRALVPGKPTVLIATIVALLSAQFTSPPEAEGGSGYSFKKAEKCFMRKINKKRARYGLRWIQRDKQLGYVARRHARSMARNSGVWHKGDLGSKVTNWQTLGQNVGRGSRCRRLFRAFWNSSKHRHNIMGKWRFVGVGTEWRSGRLYVHQVFEHRRNPGNVYHYP